jgi:hypothetical protein
MQTIEQRGNVPKEESEVLEVLAAVKPPEQTCNASKEQTNAKRQQIPCPKDRQHQTQHQHDRCSLGCCHIKRTKYKNGSQEG